MARPDRWFRITLLLCLFSGFLSLAGSERPAAPGITLSIREYCRLHRAAADTDAVPAIFGHAIVRTENEIVMFGGNRGWDAGGATNLAYAYDTQAHVWQPIVFEGTAPAGRFDHGMEAHNGWVYVYSGVENSGNLLEDFFRFQPPSGTAATAAWEPIQTTGETNPGPLMQSSLASFNNALHLYGGQDDMGNMSFNLFRLDPDHPDWTISECMGAPPPNRYGQMAVVINGIFMVFGGHNGRVHLNDLFEWDALNHRWVKMEDSTGDSLDMVPPRVKAAVAAFNDRFFVAGGEGEDYKARDDLWMYNAAEQKWQYVGELPCPLSQAAAVALNRIQKRSGDVTYEFLLHGGISDGIVQNKTYEITVTLSGIDGGAASPPEAFSLSPAFPNPFNPATVIRFDLPVPCRANLSVFDVRGRRIATLLDSDAQAGSHEARWDGKDASGMDAAAGVYVARLEAGGFRRSIKMLLGR